MSLTSPCVYAWLLPTAVVGGSFFSVHACLNLDSAEGQGQTAVTCPCLSLFLSRPGQANSEPLMKPITVDALSTAAEVTAGPLLLFFLLFLNKIPFTGYQRPFFLCIAWGQINISTTWGLGEKPGRTFLSAFFTPFFIISVFFFCTPPSTPCLGSAHPLHTYVEKPIERSCFLNWSDWLSPPIWRAQQMFLLGMLSGAECRPLSGQQGQVAMRGRREGPSEPATFPQH